MHFDLHELASQTRKYDESSFRRWLYPALIVLQGVGAQQNRTAALLCSVNSTAQIGATPSRVTFPRLEILRNGRSDDTETCLNVVISVWILWHQALSSRFLFVFPSLMLGEERFH